MSIIDRWVIPIGIGGSIGLFGTLGVIWLFDPGVSLPGLRARPAETVGAKVAASPPAAAVSTPIVAASSPREEAERRLFLSLLTQTRADILVAPIAAPDAIALDRTARSLMTHRLAQAIAARSGATVADVGLVQRALGVKRRAVPEAEVAELAKALGARVVVRGEVVRPSTTPSSVRYAQGEMQYTLRLEVTEAGAAPKRMEWTGVRFSDEVPPEEAFARMLDTVLAPLPLKLAPAPARVQAPAPDMRLPKRPLDLTVVAKPSPLEHAWRLQLFASMNPQGEVREELLWERSLVALDAVAPGSPHAEVLAARANYRLGRRPHALAILGSAATPPARALREIMMGNLPEAEAATRTITEPALRLMAEIELEDLRLAYRQSEGREERRAALIAGWPQAEALLGLRVAGSDWFDPAVLATLEKHFASVGVAPKESGTMDALKVLKDMATRRDAYGVAMMLPAQFEAAYEPTWRRHAGAWVKAGLGATFTPADYFELLFANNRDAAHAIVNTVAVMQGRYEVGARLLEAMKQGFSEDGQMAAMEVYLLQKTARQSDGQVDKGAYDRSARLARTAYLWEGGENGTSSYMEQSLAREAYAKYLDEPPYMRRAWPEPPGDRSTLTRAIPRDEVERRAAWGVRRLALSGPAGYAAVEAAATDLRELGRTAEADALVASMRGRFNGSGSRDSAVADQAVRAGNFSAAEQQLRNAVSAQPDNWDYRNRLAEFLIEQRRNGEAQEVYLAYPPFRGTASADPVAIGNRAFEGGVRLRVSGDPEAARPLFAKSLAIETGSARWMQSGESLANMDGNFEEALRFATLLHTHYKFDGAALSQILYLGLLGRTDEAWRVFRTVSRTSTGPELHNGSFFLHRMAGRSDEEVFRAAEAWRLDLDEKVLEGALRDHALFMALFLDRAPSEEAMALLRKANARHSDPSYLHVAAGYQAWQRRDYPGLIQAWSTLSANLANVSARQQQSQNYPLPYLALAYAATGKTADFKPTVNQFAERFPDSMDTRLAKAVIAAAEARPQDAEDLLWRAFVNSAPTAKRPIFSRLMVLEITEGILELTKDDRYRRLGVDLARRTQQAGSLQAYAYAFEAKHTPSAEDRRRALGAAMFLDRRSARIAQFGERERADAAAAFAALGPRSLTAPRAAMKQARASAPLALAAR